MDLLVASRNPGKVREVKRLLDALLPGKNLRVMNLADVGLPDIEENGGTFMENAMIKAAWAASRTQKVCLGEDSGLEVFALNGGPGIRSHRFSKSGTDEDNNRLLLALLEGIPRGDMRRARYKCAMVLAGPGGVIAGALAGTEGIIAEKPDGSGGFGYDPIFHSLDLGKTFGQASDKEKDGVSHRRRALEKIVETLANMAG